MKYKKQTTTRQTDANIMGFVLGKITNMVGGFTSKNPKIKHKESNNIVLDYVTKQRPNSEKRQAIKTLHGKPTIIEIDYKKFDNL